MSISEIEINNIKGISRKSFKVQLLPYKPNLLVAPNGFGKSSIATAFASMNTKGMDLAQKDHYKEDTSLLPGEFRYVTCFVTTGHGPQPSTQATAS